MFLGAHKTKVLRGHVACCPRQGVQDPKNRSHVRLVYTGKATRGRSPRQSLTSRIPTQSTTNRCPTRLTVLRVCRSPSLSLSTSVVSETGNGATMMEAELWKISDNILVLMNDKKGNDGLVMNQSEAPAGDAGSYCCSQPNAADQWVKSISDGTGSGAVVLQTQQIISQVTCSSDSSVSC